MAQKPTLARDILGGMPKSWICSKIRLSVGTGFESTKSRTLKSKKSIFPGWGSGIKNVNSDPIFGVLRKLSNSGVLSCQVGFWPNSTNLTKFDKFDQNPHGRRDGEVGKLPDPPGHFAKLRAPWFILAFPGSETSSVNSPTQQLVNHLHHNNLARSSVRGCVCRQVSCHDFGQRRRREPRDARPIVYYGGGN